MGLFCIAYARRLCRGFVAWVGALLFVFVLHAWAQPGKGAAQISYDAATRTFRIDAADTSYVMGVNEKSELQQLYWGQRLRSGDPLPTPQSAQRRPPASSRRSCSSCCESLSLLC